MAQSIYSSEGSGQYEQEYQEVQCIGRGNFGAAFLVKNKLEGGKEYIAKKILLGALGEKEQESALMEVNLLKNLNHPNIVAYKTSYISQGMLVIVMEYLGDLSFHIKRRQAKGEPFTETEIFNWFVQLCLSLEYIHGRKVLHRDLKSQNVFLTGNNTVKLGDFGISRVLENTSANAMTVVGTPYYMSPEVCQNQPYTFKSDVWALGCVLYELCTLKHAFSADNLLGLVYKIVQDKYDPIPACYSKELQNLISALLNKNAQERPSVSQILQMPIVRQKMIEFVNSGGMTIGGPNRIYIKNAPVVKPVQDFPQQQYVGQGSPQTGPRDDEDEFKHLTPKERMAKKKEMEVQRKIQEATQHAKEASSNYAKAHEMKYQQLYASDKKAIGVAAGSNYPMPQMYQQQQQQFEQTVIHNRTAQQALQQTQSQYQQNLKVTRSGGFEGSHTGFQVNDRTVDFELSDSLASQFAGLQINQPQMPQSPARFNNPAAQQVTDDRKLTGTGTYDFGDYTYDFEFEDDLNEITVAKENRQELDEVLDNYQRILSQSIGTKIDDYKDLISRVDGKRKDEEYKKEPAQMSTASTGFSSTGSGFAGTMQIDKQMMMQNQKSMIMTQLGPDLFQYIYSFLRYQRSRPDSVDERYIQEEVKKMIGGDKKLTSAVFSLDVIVFQELEAESKR